MTENKDALVRIVDDDAEQLKSLAFLLRMGGFEVMTYQSAQSFLEMDDPRKPGCLLLDHRMPGMTGMELQAELVERGSLLPVIFLSYLDYRCKNPMDAGCPSGSTSRRRFPGGLIFLEAR